MAAVKQLLMQTAIGNRFCRFRVDILPGTGVNADQYDEDGDGTSFTYVLPAPMIAANPTWDGISASGMPVGTWLTLTIKEDGQQVFQSDPTPIDQNPNDPNDISARFDLKGFDVRPGQELTVNFGDDLIHYTVTDFQITNIDLVGDQITGIGTPYSRMEICVNLGDHIAFRYPVADGNGDWAADFGNPSTSPNEQEIVDIKPVCMVGVTREMPGVIKPGLPGMYPTHDLMSEAIMSSTWLAMDQRG